MYRTQRGTLFFNSIHKFVGVNFDGVNYHPATTLNSYQMVGIFTINFFFLFQFYMA